MRWAGLVVVAACAAPAAPAAIANRPTGPAACIVTGAYVSRQQLSVRPAGAAPLAVDIDHLPVTATFDHGVHLHVGGAIAFEAVADRFPMRIVRPVSTAEVRLARGAVVLADREVSGEVRGDAVMDIYGSDSGTPAESVGPVDVPCADLALDNQPDQPMATDAAIGDSAWAPGHGIDRVALHRAPDRDSPTVTITRPGCTEDWCLVFGRVAERDGWMQVVRARWGVTVTGWVPAMELHRMPDDEEGGVAGSICGCDDGEHVMFGPPHVVHPPRGTHLYAEPNGAPWSTIHDDVALEVMIRQPGWGEVRSLPGIHLRRGHAFIRVPDAL